MANRYGKIYGTIWSDDKFKSLHSQDAKLMYFYLISNSSCNSVGIFKVNPIAIASDFAGKDLEEDYEELGKVATRIKDALTELAFVGIINYKDKWVWFNKYLSWNLPQTPNHVKSCVSEITEVAKSGCPKEAVCDYLSKVKNALSGIKGKFGDKVCTYYDMFKTAMDKQFFIDFFGSETVLADCMNGRQCAFNKDDIKQNKQVFDKSLASTTEVLNKSLASTTQGLGNKEEEEEEEKETEEEKDKKSFFFDTSNKENAPELTLPCAQGQLRVVDPASLRPVTQALGCEAQTAMVKIQTYCYVNNFFPINDDEAVNYFLNHTIIDAIHRGEIKSE